MVYKSPVSAADIADIRALDTVALEENVVRLGELAEHFGEIDSQGWAAHYYDQLSCVAVSEKAFRAAS